MEDKDWAILEVLYEEKNITRAADRLFISQPSLTYRLQQIEKEFGVTLLYRGRRGVEFTEQGEFLVQYAKEMQIKLKNMKELLWNLEGKVQGTLRLGVSRAIALYRLPGWLKKFSEQYPLVDFTVNTGLNLDLIASVHKQEVHIGIVRGDHHWSEEKKVLEQEEICIISDKKIIDLNQLPQLPRINYKTDPALNMIIDTWWKGHFNKPPDVSMMVENMEIAKRMVMNGLGYAIVPSIVFEKGEQLNCIHLLDKKDNPILWTTWMLYRKEFLELSTVKAFVSFISEQSMK
ncbi:LysR family transcriptional regulator [Paenibacillus glycanilyticus]|uniref:LysR family transcriptional regulator n=1 Tax=Paenibacillus glycanilyticus TaxID=126569 RepID=UPI001910A4C7|nr:LysR family transcriptional regulator [Paenibacillus glycanilyticus]